MAVNCAAIQESLGGADLFGWEHGAFTGAVRRGVGLLAAAHGGTLFLDEACSLPLAMQARLLRVLEERAVRRVGAVSLVPAEFRLVVALSERLDNLVQAGRVRADFAYRIAGLVVSLPPLRERGSDLPLLADHFLNAGNGHPARELKADALEIMDRYPWPGNVRELRITMERLRVLVDAEGIDAVALASALTVRREESPTGDRLEWALAQAGGSLSAAARLLGIPRTTLRRRLEAQDDREAFAS